MRKPTYVNTLPSVRELMHASQGVGQLRIAIWQLVAQTDDSKKREFQQNVTDAEKVINAELTKYEREDMDEPPDVFAKDKALLDADRDTLSKVLKIRDQALKLVIEGKNAEARDFVMEQQAVMRSMVDAFEAHIKMNMDAANEASTIAASAKSMATLWNGVVGVVTLALVVLLGLYITRSITGPLKEAIGVAERVANGDLSEPVIVSGNDELTQLLKALAHMNSSLVDVVSKVRGGSESVATASAQIAQGNNDLSQRTGRNSCIHGRTRLHCPAKRRQRQTGQPIGAKCQCSRHQGWRSGGSGGGHHEGHKRLIQENC
jgi:methyl-accepting chemotaxis protein